MHMNAYALDARESFTDWDHLEESAACLMEAAVGSQLLEGDQYPTSSLVVPTVFP